MEDEIISLRIDKITKEKMKMLEHINWSAVLRKTIKEQIERQKEKEHIIDLTKAKKASNLINEIRKSRTFDGGKSSVKIIREWRNKRKL